MIEIKHTKSIRMIGDKDAVNIVIGKDDLWIPMKKVFQVKRGLESYVQRFYRKQK